MRSTKPVVFIAAALGLIGAASVTNPAFASGQGSQNTATALGAGAVYELSQHHTGAGLLLGLGAVVAESQAQRQFSREDCNDGGYYYQGGWNGGDHGWPSGGRDWDHNDHSNWGGDRHDSGWHGSDGRGSGWNDHRR